MDVLPPELALPEAAPWQARLRAGARDAGVSVSAGAVLGSAVHALGGVAEVSAWSAALGALLAWSARDALWEDGRRSWGKASESLEVVYWDGTLASPADAGRRGLPWLLLPLIGAHPIVTQGAFLVLAFDLASALVTTDGRSAGDYALGTRVAAPRPERERRVADARLRERMLEIEAELAEIHRDLPRALAGDRPLDALGDGLDDAPVAPERHVAQPAAPSATAAPARASVASLLGMRNTQPVAPREEPVAPRDEPVAPPAASDMFARSHKPNSQFRE